VPEDWRIANVSPVFQKAGKKDPGNYRPVRLTWIPRKIGMCCHQRDLSSLEKWAGGYLMKFSKRKCEVLHLVRNNPMHQNMLGAVCLESSFAEMVLQVLVDNKLTMR